MLSDLKQGECFIYPHDDVLVMVHDHQFDDKGWVKTVGYNLETGKKLEWGRMWETSISPDFKKVEIELVRDKKDALATFSELKPGDGCGWCFMKVSDEQMLSLESGFLTFVAPEWRCSQHDSKIIVTR